MFRPLYTILFSLFNATVVLAAGETLPYKTNVVVDGINQEWEPRLPKYDQTTGINYQISNDEKNLYFILRISDMTTQMQIMRFGMELWINPDGKKRKSTGITFPLPMSKEALKERARQPRPEGQNAPGKEDGATMGQEIPINTRELILTGFLLENGKQSVKNCPIKVALSRDNAKCLIYELAVPFNTFYKESVDQTDAKVKFCFGFVLKTADKKQEEGNVDAMGGPMGGYGGPGGYGGYGGPGGYGGYGAPGYGGYGGTTGQRTPTALSMDKTIWIKSLLNIKK